MKDCTLNILSNSTHVHSMSTTSPPGGPSDSPNRITEAPDPRLTPLEAEVLDEYTRLRTNLDNLSKALADLSAQPTSAIADGLRGLERKTALVCTALKSSVYGIVLQQQMEFAESEVGSVDGGERE